MNEIIKMYTQFISSVDGVIRIYLFGSHAYGEPHSESDIDMLVVVDNDLDPLKTNIKINKALAGKRTFPLDIIVNNESAFEKAAENMSLQNRIKNDGVLLYDTGKYMADMGTLRA